MKMSANHGKEYHGIGFLYPCRQAGLEDSSFINTECNFQTRQTDDKDYFA